MKKRILRTIIIFVIVRFSLQIMIPAVGFAQNQSFRGMQTKKSLERAKKLDPDNYAIAYYLGMIYSEEGNYHEAIKEWESYLKIAPQDNKAIAIRERLTILKFNDAEEHARYAVREGHQRMRWRVRRDTLAVGNFKNQEYSKYDLLCKGLTEMIITDLAKIPSLNIVERVRILALLNEIRMGEADITDETIAAKAGRLLMAKYLIWGKVDEIREKEIRIHCSVTETFEGTLLGTSEAERPVLKFFELEKEILFGILKVLGLKKEGLDSSLLTALEKKHTTNFDAFLSYAQGLDFMDQQKFAEAKEAFARAISIDSGFDMAQEALISTPASSIEDIDQFSY